MNLSATNEELLKQKINEFLKDLKKKQKKMQEKEDEDSLIHKKLRRYKNLRRKMNSRRERIKHIKDHLYTLGGALHETRHLYYCYNNKYYKIDRFFELNIPGLSFPDNIDYQVSRAINEKVKDIIDEEVRNIKDEITSLMKKVIEIEVDFINRNDIRLIEHIGLTQKICEEKIAAKCAFLIDYAFPMYNYKDSYNDFGDIQQVIKKYLGYCNWDEDNKGRYYYDDGIYRDVSISLIEYYYMLDHFDIDFVDIYDSLSRNPDYKDYFIDDYEYSYLYKEIGGHDFFEKNNTFFKNFIV